MMDSSTMRWLLARSGRDRGMRDQLLKAHEAERQAWRYHRQKVQELQDLQIKQIEWERKNRAGEVE